LKSKLFEEKGVRSGKTSQAALEEIQNSGFDL
jgi:hypothetical protein